MSKEQEIPLNYPRDGRLSPSYPSPHHMPPPMPQPIPQTAHIGPQAVHVPLGPEPCMLTCPSCHATVLSRVSAEPGTQTHLMAILLCLICICCTCIPYLVDACQNVVHRCGNCDAYLGTYKR